MSDLQKRLLEAFRMECPEHLEGIRSTLLSAENQELSEDDFYSVMRYAHTLKGAARAAGLAPIEGAAHDLESAFSAAKKGEGKLEARFVGAVESLLDAVESWLSFPQENRSPLPSLESLLNSEGAKPTAEPEEPARDLATNESSVRLSERALDSILVGAGEMLSPFLV